MKPRFAGSWILGGLALTLAFPISLQAQNWRLYVDNSNGEDISVIDLKSLKVVDDFKLGAALPHGLALRPDGKLLFVTVE
jgi:DNA-binding beta-propeller fold protein YncE